VTRFTITHACTHEELHDIVQGNAARQAWIAKRRGEKPCSTCSRVAWQAEVDSMNAYYAELATEHGLPELTGTERQVPWAIGLRGELLDKVAECLPQLHRICVEHGRPFHYGATDVIRELAMMHTDAAWWIQNREHLPNALVDAHRKGLKLSGEAGVTAKQLLLYLETVR
jgi:hypothetical protein